MRTVTWCQMIIYYYLLLVSFFSCARGVPFSWESCSKPSDPMKIISLNVYQNSTEFLYVTGNGKVGFNLTSPITGNVKMWKKTLFGWILIPCVDGFGSCLYKDICLLSPYTNECPEIYKEQELPCSCPIPMGKYNVTDFPVDIKFLPEWLEKGLYKIKAILTWNEKELICVKMTIDLM